MTKPITVRLLVKFEEVGRLFRPVLSIRPVKQLFGLPAGEYWAVLIPCSEKEEFPPLEVTDDRDILEEGVEHSQE